MHSRESLIDAFEVSQVQNLHSDMLLRIHWRASSRPDMAANQLFILL